MEEWKVIPEWEDYAASSLGRIKRIKADKCGRHAGRIMSQKRGWHGYMEIGLFRDKKQITLRVSRLVCSAFHGTPTHDRPHAAHKNGVRDDNRSENLRWSTRSDNERDKLTHGTRRLGVMVHNSKLNDDIVRQIRADERSHRIIAEELGVDRSIIGDVKNRKTWRHVNG